MSTGRNLITQDEKDAWRDVISRLPPETFAGLFSDKERRQIEYVKSLRTTEVIDNEKGA